MFKKVVLDVKGDDQVLNCNNHINIRPDKPIIKINHNFAFGEHFTDLHIQNLLKLSVCRVSLHLYSPQLINGFSFINRKVSYQFCLFL